MKLKLSELKSVINEVAAQLHEETIKSSDGRTYSGDRNKIASALIKFGSSGPERAAIIAGNIPIGAQALAYLKSQSAVKRDERPRDYKPRMSPHRSSGLTFQSALNKLTASIKRYAKNWTNFTTESPDVDPQDAAPDAAQGFFYEEPNWKKWADAMGIKKYEVKEMCAEYIHDAMTS